MGMWGAEVGVLGDSLFFFGYRGGHGVFKTKGTPESTELVKSGIYYGSFIPWSPTVLLWASTSGVFRTDGTEAGTASLLSGSELSVARVGNNLYARSSAGGNKLLVTDGTAANVPIVPSLLPLAIAPHNNALYLIASEQTDARVRLFRLDAKDGTPYPVADSFVPKAFGCSAGDVLFLVGETAATGAEPWVTRGTTSSTSLLLDVNEGAAGSDPESFTRVGGLVFFSAVYEELGRELWVTNGSAAGTRLVADICPGACSSSPTWLTEYYGHLFFVVDGELWTSDGTEEGTAPACPEQSGCTDVQRITRIGSNLILSGDVGSGREPLIFP